MLPAVVQIVFVEKPLAQPESEAGAFVWHKCEMDIKFQEAPRGSLPAPTIRAGNAGLERQETISVITEARPMTTA